MDRKQVIDKITSSLVSPAGNGNGLLLRGPNGHYIVATDAGHTRLASG
jgi:hypothetical protein